jgi:hypothetical protein
MKAPSISEQMNTCISVLVLLVLASFPGLAAVTHITTAAQFSDALWDDTVSQMLVAADLDLVEEQLRWQDKFRIDFLLARNLTISAAQPGTFPRIDWALWPARVPGIRWCANVGTPWH